MKKSGKLLELFFVGLFSAIPAIYMALREDKIIDEKVHEAIEQEKLKNEEEAD